MNFKTVASSASVVTFVFGLAFLLAPLQTLAVYGNQSTDPVVTLMTHYFGSSFISFGAIAWSIRGIENIDVQRLVAKLTAVATLLGAGVSLQAVLAGTLNAMGWSSVAIYLIFAALWARIGFVR